jgi:hypothetical protein
LADLCSYEESPKVAYRGGDAEGKLTAYWKSEHKGLQLQRY